MTHPNPALYGGPQLATKPELVDRWIVADVLGEHRSEERQRSCGPTIVATRYDKYALTYLGGVILAAAITFHRLQLTDTT